MMQRPPGDPPSESSSRPLPRWGERDYRPPGKAKRRRRLLPWLAGIVGAIMVAGVLAAGIFLIMLAGGRFPALTSGAAVGASATDGTGPVQEPGTPTTSPSAAKRSGTRSTTAHYSIRVPPALEDITKPFRKDDPKNHRFVVQALAGVDGSAPSQDSIIVVQRLPNPSGLSTSAAASSVLDQRRRQGARPVGASVPDTLGSERARRLTATAELNGERLRLTDVVCVHRGWIWVVAVNSPADRSKAAISAWRLIQASWHWR